MKIINSIILLNMNNMQRITITFSEIDETGKVTSDNNKVTRVLAQPEQLAAVAAMDEIARQLLTIKED